MHADVKTMAGGEMLTSLPSNDVCYIALVIIWYWLYLSCMDCNFVHLKLNAASRSDVILSLVFTGNCDPSHS